MAELLGNHGPAWYSGKDISTPSGIAQPLFDANRVNLQTITKARGEPFLASVTAPRVRKGDKLTFDHGRALVLYLTPFRNGVPPPPKPPRPKPTLDELFDPKNAPPSWLPEDPGDPFVTRRPPPSGPTGPIDPNAPPPTRKIEVRTGVSLRLDYIEIEQADYFRLIGSTQPDWGEALWEKTLNLISKDKAKVWDTSFLLSRSGHIAKSRSGKELIFSSDYFNPPGIKLPLPAVTNKKK